MKKLTVKNPCQEKWENMNEHRNGKFCTSCAKNVVDLTALSEFEILKKLHAAKGNLCARVTERQLLTPLPTGNTKFRLSFPYPNMAASLLLAAALASNTTAEAQHNKTSVEYPIDIKKSSQIAPTGLEEYATDEKTEIEVKAIESISVQGKVVDGKTKQALKGVVVSFLTLEKLFTAVSDENGMFHLEVPQAFVQKKNVLFLNYNELETKEIFNYYDNKEIIFTKEELSKKLIIEADYLMIVMGGIGSISYRRLPDPIVFSNGEKLLDYEKNIENLYKLSSGYDSPKYRFHLFSEAAALLYGRRVKSSLYLFFDKE